jgi:hypothetical protein
VRERADHDQASPRQSPAWDEKFGKEILEGTVDLRKESIQLLSEAGRMAGKAIMQRGVKF